MLEKAQKAVDCIIADLCERAGLEDEWDLIDEETQAEIRDTWIEYVIHAMESGEVQ